jgi:hypothetical protein
MLWKYDRGSHPRTEAGLRQAIGRHFEVVRVESRTNNHRYLLLTLRPRAAVPHHS